MVPLFYQFLKQTLKNHRSTNVFKEVKYFKRWAQSLQKQASSVIDEQPWITFKTIDYLNKFLTKDARVFEYGGGGSSLFFVKRVKLLVTAEHNKEWFDILSKLMTDKGITNWDGNLIQAQAGDFVSAPNSANPAHYASQDEAFKSHHFFNYASRIDSFDDSYFDVVLVDGRSRPSCFKHAISKLKKGGLLVLDNSDRTYYREFLEEEIKSNFNIICDEKGACPYLREFTQTAIFEKKR